MSILSIRAAATPIATLAAAATLAACGAEQGAVPKTTTAAPSAQVPESAAPTPAVSEPEPPAPAPAVADPETTAQAAPSVSERDPVVRTDGSADDLRVPTASWETDFSRHTVDLSEIQSGGPPKDGIPPIDEPLFVTPADASEWLEEREPVIELAIDGDVRAYPLQILIWHEIVNDLVGDVPVSVTFCPLCGTALVFDRRLDGRVLDFGTTGNLRNSDLVMYDRQTETWWQQFGGEAIVGELAGRRLTQLPARIVAWEDFRARNPQGTVLSRETGESRAYGQNPYPGYDNVDSPPFFPVSGDDDRLPPKERVVLLERDADVAVVPFSALAELGSLTVEVGGATFDVDWVEGVGSALGDATIAEADRVGSADVRDAATGEPAAFDTPFWFAVASFRPDARIVRSADQ